MIFENLNSVTRQVNFDTKNDKTAKKRRFKWDIFGDFQTMSAQSSLFLKAQGKIRKNTLQNEQNNSWKFVYIKVNLTNFWKLKIKNKNCDLTEKSNFFRTFYGAEIVIKLILEVMKIFISFGHISMLEITKIVTRLWLIWEQFFCKVHRAMAGISWNDIFFFTGINLYHN